MSNPFNMSDAAIEAIFANTSKASRRGFLAQAGAGLTLAFTLPAIAKPLKSAATKAKNGFSSSFVNIGSDNSVTVICKHLEMGQGIYSGFATVIADELDADWSQMRVTGAPARVPEYTNAKFGSTMQGTGGSTSMSSSYDILRKAGATARAMLIQAAAELWAVPAADIQVKNGILSHAGSGRTASFGQLAARAGTLPVPKEVKLKSPDQFIYIGKDNGKRLDQKNKATGREVYAIDMTLPGLKVAMIARAPKFGATLKSFDATKAKAMPGVVDVVQVPRGVAVIANNSWTAKKARDSLVMNWDLSGAEQRSTTDFVATYKQQASLKGQTALSLGNIEAAFAGADKVIEAEYLFPYLAHAAMEPLSCTGRMTATGCELWSGFQFHTLDQANAAQVLGLKAEQVILHSLHSGGSFGRRANPSSDYVSETASLLKASSGKYPIKLLWSREDDMTGGYYRPMYLHKIAVALDKQGRITGWKQVQVGQALFDGTPFAPKEGVETSAYEGVAPQQYDLPAADISWVKQTSPIPVLWWRSVEHTHTAFSKEVMMDKIARATGQDPLALRLSYLGKHPRHAAVLKLAADKAGWAEKPASTADVKRGRGLAVHESFGSFVAVVADVAIAKDGSLKVERLVCAVDCGFAISPDSVRAQMEGGMAFGLGAALGEAITFKDGVTEQTNYDSYNVMKIDAHPKKIEVHILNSGHAPTGTGEPGTPVATAAVANAISAATGVSMNQMPWSGTDLKWG